jgi:hypothetical protein
VICSDQFATEVGGGQFLLLYDLNVHCFSGANDRAGVRDSI